MITTEQLLDLGFKPRNLDINDIVLRDRYILKLKTVAIDFSAALGYFLISSGQSIGIKIKVAHISSIEELKVLIKYL